MRNYWMAAILISTFMASGCSGAFWGGAGSGILGAGAGYEVHANAELKKIDEDLKAGRIDKREYDIRKDQIRRDSLLQ